MADFIFDQDSSIVQVTATTPEAYQHLRDHVNAEGWQWLGRTLNIDWRAAQALSEALEEDGYSVSY